MRLKRFNSKVSNLIKSAMSYGGFDPAELARAHREVSSDDTYSSPADTPELQQESRPYYCTPSHYKDLIDSIPGAIDALDRSNVEASYFFTSAANAYDPDHKSELESQGKAIIKPYKELLDSLRSRAESSTLVHTNPFFGNTGLVQPGHLVTLRSPEGSSRKIYLLSHQSPELEMLHPGAEQVAPHSFLGQELLLKPRGAQVVAKERINNFANDLFGAFRMDQSIYREEARRKRQLTPKEQDDLLHSQGYISYNPVDYGTITDIETPHPSAFAGGPSTFNSGS